MSDREKKLGEAGELLAANFLAQKGYSIIQRNFRCKVGEIDIIASDGNYLVFVEVKTRRSLNYGSPVEAVDIRKQQQIYRTALFYLQQNAIDNQDIRFDIIAITMMDEKPAIEHIVNAFDICW